IWYSGKFGELRSGMPSDLGSLRNGSIRDLLFNAVRDVD
ncbi:hypothetical protein Tco_0647321, partial [Tanacetum coccineum]